MSNPVELHSNLLFTERRKTVSTLICLIANNRVTRNIDPDEALRYFSWSRFAVIAVAYTAVVFWLELAKDGPFILSPKNDRSIAKVLLAHAQRRSPRPRCTWAESSMRVLLSGSEIFRVQAGLILWERVTCATT
jgi:hypothetical protein